MQYFLYPFILLIYFEVFGRWFLMKINKPLFEYCFPIGFLVIMAILYLISWPITSFNGNFYHLAILYGILFLISAIFIFKDFKKISFKFDLKMWIIFFVFLAISIGISYTKTLGDPHGFDALYYVNTVSFNIGNTELNSLHPHFGTYPNTDIQWITYVFDAYYYFVEVIIWVFRNILSLIGLSFNTMPAFVWGFEILQEMFTIAISILCIKELNSQNKILNITFYILLILFIGNFYYNNVFGFIGNNYRMATHALSTIYLFRYFKNKDIKDFYLFLICMLGMCALSSTGCFSLLFILIGLFFVLCDKEKKLIKIYVVTCVIPAINILVSKFNQQWWIYVGVIVLFTIIWLLNDFILNLFKNKKIRIITIILAFILMFGLSLSVTGNPFDFNTFINNYSEIQDMSWDYFMFNDIRHWIFNLIVLIPLFYFLIKNKTHPFSMVSWILIIVFFNPFVCTFMNKINWVYYRAYDIIINQFTLIYFINYMIENISLKYLGQSLSIITLISSIILSVIQIPRYYHESFKPDEDYNPIYKIENSELDLINNLRKMIKDKDIKNPKIINQTYYLAPYIEGSTYLIGKERRYNYDAYDKVSFSLYLIFYPSDGWDNLRPADEPPYDDLVELLKECDYDILIVDYNLFATINGTYQQVVEYLDNEGTFVSSEYSTGKYAVYYLKDRND